MNKPLEREFHYFLDHQDELADQYDGKVLVIMGDQVLGAYSSIIDAVDETTKEFPLGTFLVQRCARGPEVYTQTFHSHVTFA